jgi:hypothetical protein
LQERAINIPGERGGRIQLFGLTPPHFFYGDASSFFSISDENESAIESKINTYFI